MYVYVYVHMYIYTDIHSHDSLNNYAATPGHVERMGLYGAFVKCIILGEKLHLFYFIIPFLFTLPYQMDDECCF